MYIFIKIYSYIFYLFCSFLVTNYTEHTIFFCHELFAWNTYLPLNSSFLTVKICVPWHYSLNCLIILHFVSIVGVKVAYLSTFQKFMFFLIYKVFSVFAVIIYNLLKTNQNYIIFFINILPVNSKKREYIFLSHDINLFLLFIKSIK